MGYAVVHLEKAKGSDSGMSAHIERTVAPKNADKERTHLNREMITFPDGVTNRTEAIQHRLETAGLKRKIASNQVRAIRVLMTGTHEDMIKIESEGKLDEWCDDNLNWLRQHFGKDNVVSAVLHLDEKTPHIHATVIPIVETERKRRKREEQVKKTYRKKKPTPRLCADEVMSRVALKGYQDSYAHVMEKYGLQRGVDGSEAKHISTSQYYRDLQQQSESLQENISELLTQQEQAEKELSATKTDISKEKFKNSAADVGSKILDGASSLFGTSKVKRLEAENEQLKSQNISLIESTVQEKEELKTQYKNENHQLYQHFQTKLQESEQREKSLKDENSTLRTKISKLFDIFPNLESMLNMERFLQKIGFGIEIIRKLFNREKVNFKGNIYSSEFGRHFKTDGSTAQLTPNPKQNGNLSLEIDNLDHSEWFREKKNEELKQMGIDVQESKQRRAVGM